MYAMFVCSCILGRSSKNLDQRWSIQNQTHADTLQGIFFRIHVAQYSSLRFFGWCTQIMSLLPQPWRSPWKTASWTRTNRFRRHSLKSKPCVPLLVRNNRSCVFWLLIVESPNIVFFVAAWCENSVAPASLQYTLSNNSWISNDCINSLISSCKWTLGTMCEAQNPA